MLEMWIEEKKRSVDETILSILPKGESLFHQALNYSLFPGGKRIRPLLCLASCEACGEATDEVYRVASAIEIIHSYSLVHDDIIDTDEIRRQKPSVYKEYGENLAILVGDALLTLSFEILIDSPDVAKEIILASSKMIEGQVEEMAISEQATKDQLHQISLKKTASLFSASCVAGGIIGGGNRKQVDALRIAGEKFGLAFQIADDLADKEKGGVNILAVLSPESAKEEITSLIDSANTHLSIFQDTAGVIKELIHSINNW
ncbi:polyprenyl synthetase family protein [bacterium]|nr:polyprenyl synthetase family protein [bacterium]MBU1598859.1 polyprenyl synthetase family protein [bacterium]